MQTRSSEIITKTFFKLLPVQIILVAISSVNSVIDGAVAANFIGPTALAVTGLIMPLARIIDTLNTTLLGGSQILCGQLLGKNQVKTCSGVFTLDMVCVLSIGVFMTLLCTLIPGPLSGLLVQDSGLVRDLAAYVRGYGFGIIPQMMSAQLAAFLQLERQEKRTYAGMVMMIIVNVAMDLLFVSVLKMGVFGLGLATAVGNWVFTLILGSYYALGKASISFSTKEVRWRTLADILRVGFPGAVSQCAQVVRGFLLNLLIVGTSGEIGISAFSAVNTYGGLFYATVAGVGTATRLLFSVYVGEDDRVGVTDIMRVALTRGLGLTAGVCCVIAACSGLLARTFYTPDMGALYALTVAGFIATPLSMIFSCLCIVFINYYQCREKMGLVNAMSAFDGVIGIMAFSYLLAPRFGLNGVWAAQVMNGLPPLLLVFGYVWKVSGTLPRNIPDFLLLNQGFGVPAERRIDLTVASMDEVLNLSEQVFAFCQAQGIDHRRSFFASLSVEEMAGNIVSHGFRDSKHHSVDVRIVCKPDCLLIRLKDDGRPFNPKERQELLDPKDVTHNIGLRMISRLAKTMEYQNSFGLNVLTITV